MSEFNDMNFMGNGLLGSKLSQKNYDRVHSFLGMLNWIESYDPINLKSCPGLKPSAQTLRITAWASFLHFCRCSLRGFSLSFLSFLKVWRVEAMSWWSSASSPRCQLSTAWWISGYLLPTRCASMPRYHSARWEGDLWHRPWCDLCIPWQKSSHQHWGFQNKNQHALQLLEKTCQPSCTPKFLTTFSGQLVASPKLFPADLTWRNRRVEDQIPAVKLSVSLPPSGSALRHQRATLPQPLSHSALLPEWLEQPLSHSATLSDWVAEWLESHWSVSDITQT